MSVGLIGQWQINQFNTYFLGAAGKHKPSKHIKDEDDDKKPGKIDDDIEDDDDGKVKFDEDMDDDDDSESVDVDGDGYEDYD